MTPTMRRALEIIRDKPNIWPAGFAREMWSETHPLLLRQRNKVGAPMASWWAAGYLGRLRKAGWIRGGGYVPRPGGSYDRDPISLTAKAREALGEVVGEDSRCNPSRPVLKSGT